MKQCGSCGEAHGSTAHVCSSVIGFLPIVDMQSTRYSVLFCALVPLARPLFWTIKKLGLGTCSCVVLPALINIYHDADPKPHDERRFCTLSCASETKQETRCQKKLLKTCKHAYRDVKRFSDDVVAVTLPHDRDRQTASISAQGIKR
jgi:hypothetical protein